MIVIVMKNLDPIHKIWSQKYEERYNHFKKKLHKLQDKSSSLQTKINKILIDTLNGKTSGKEYSVTKQFEDYRKELEKNGKRNF